MSLWQEDFAGENLNLFPRTRMIESPFKVLYIVNSGKTLRMTEVSGDVELTDDSAEALTSWLIGEINLG